VPKQLAKVGESFSFQVQATNSLSNASSIPSASSTATELQFQATGLPPEISINESSGLISGIPTIAGLFPVRVTVQNAFGLDESRFLIKIEGGDVSLSRVYLPTVIRSR
jgi:hypothetical protein